jgi:hypothetical protein
MDYLSRLYAIRTLLLPSNDALYPPPTPIPNAEVLPGIHRISIFAKDMANRQLEDHQSIYPGMVLKHTKTIHLDWKTEAELVHFQWISNLDDNTLILLWMVQSLKEHSLEQGG